MAQQRTGTTFRIDTSTDSGARAMRHLQHDQIVWLTTVGNDLTPQPSPVWSYWDGETVVIYSQPNAPKVRNIRDRPRVSLSFNSTPTGGDVVVLTGEAWIDEEALAASKNDGYLEKYREGLKSIEMSLEELAREYSTAVRVRPTTLRGF